MKRLISFAIIFFFQIGFAQSAADYFNEGKKLYEAKNYSEAIKKFDQAIALKYNDPELYILKGNSLSHSDDKTAAIENYTKAIEIDPKSARAYFNRGVSYREKEQYDKAIADFTSAFESDPTDASALMQRASINFYSQNNYNKAILDMEKYIALEPKDALGFLFLGICTSKVDSKPKTIAKCIEYFTKSIELDDTESNSYYYRGYAYYDKGDNKKAMKDFDKAIELDPKKHEAYFERGNLFLDAKDYQKQIANYDKAIEFSPKSGKYYYWRGYAKLFGLKDKDAACIDYLKAIDLGFEKAEEYKSLCSTKGRTFIITE